MANFLPQGALFQPVRELTHDDLNKNTARGRATWKTLGDREQKRLLGLIALRQAIKEKDALAVVKLAKAYESLVAEIVGVRPREPREKQTEKWFVQSMAREKGGGIHQRVLAEVLSKALTPARLVLWWKDSDERLLPAVYCPNAAAALYVRALLSTVGGKALLVCRHCGEPFVQQRSDQDYCSIRCREAHRVARWRATPHDKVKKAGKGR